MNITECKVNLVQNMGRTKGFCSMVIDDAIVIRGIRIQEAQNGFSVSFPQRQRKDGEYEDVVKPVSKEAYREIALRVTDAYGEAQEEAKRAKVVGEMIERGRDIYKSRTGQESPDIPGPRKDGPARAGQHESSGYHRPSGRGR